MGGGVQGGGVLIHAGLNTYSVHCQSFVGRCLYQILAFQDGSVSDYLPIFVNPRRRPSAGQCWSTVNGLLRILNRWKPLEAVISPSRH